ncbi:MAG: 6-phosphogluconolactonase [Proteobacteria bacterium]|nr:6-phosphogluconolactonase [Pseudomonadota bacterium]
MRPKIKVFKNRDELSAALAAHVAHLAARACAGQGRFSIALSGGSLIEIISSGLCSDPLRGSIDWSSWHVFWADERWVSSSSPLSNYGLAAKLFFSRVSIPRDQIHATDNAIKPSETAKDYESVLAKIFQPPEGRMPRFDLILLGVGEDGHTASLFPDHPVLAERRAWVVSVSDAPKPPPIRITMTLPLINNARNLVFVAVGPSKADIVSKVFNPQMQNQELPARLVNPSDGEVQWFVDRAAATESGRT